MEAPPGSALGPIERGFSHSPESLLRASQSSLIVPKIGQFLVPFKHPKQVITRYSYIHIYIYIEFAFGRNFS